MQIPNNSKANSPLWVMTIAAEIWLNLMIQDYWATLASRMNNCFYRLCNVLR
jgi:hypothetical protein